MCFKQSIRYILSLGLFISLTNSSAQSKLKDGLLINNTDTSEVRFNPKNVWKTKSSLELVEKYSDKVYQQTADNHLFVYLNNTLVKVYSYNDELIFLESIVYNGEMRLLRNRYSDSYYLLHHDQITALESHNFMSKLEEAVKTCSKSTEFIQKSSVEPVSLNYNKDFFSKAVENYNDCYLEKSKSKSDKKSSKFKYTSIKGPELGYDFKQSGILLGYSFNHFYSKSFSLEFGFKFHQFKSQVSRLTSGGVSRDFNSNNYTYKTPVGFRFFLMRSNIQPSIFGGAVLGLNVLSYDDTVRDKKVSESGFATGGYGGLGVAFPISNKHLLGVDFFVSSQNDSDGSTMIVVKYMF